MSRGSDGFRGLAALEEIARRLTDLAGSVAEAGGRAHEHDVTVDTPAGPLKARMGVHVRPAAPGRGAAPGRPRPPSGAADPARRPAAEPAPAPAAAPPLTEVIDAGPALLVVTEARDGTTATAEPRRLLVRDPAGVRVVDLPRPVRPETLAVTVAGGFLEARLLKHEDPSS